MRPVIPLSQQPCDVRDDGPILQVSRASLPEAREAVTPNVARLGSTPPCVSPCPSSWALLRLPSVTPPRVDEPRSPVTVLGASPRNSQGPAVALRPGSGPVLCSPTHKDSNASPVGAGVASGVFRQ